MDESIDRYFRISEHQAATPAEMQEIECPPWSDRPSTGSRFGEFLRRFLRSSLPFLNLKNSVHTTKKSSPRPHHDAPTPCHPRWGKRADKGVDLVAAEQETPCFDGSGSLLWREPHLKSPCVAVDSRAMVGRGVTSEGLSRFWWGSWWGSMKVLLCPRRERREDATC